ncbi:long-chain fatty acid--CoA ligase [Roseobacter denitrificans]|uniref:Benzoate--CoA ligase n=1 Tax=Roseobacter denitrificans (strain ATCC 33942 / OCh 114) TaxID=375451 RepID=Q165R7_ROSDO|nr:class I adenylate-forming enzyme family protein [Roseobacter denitrificans]ABG32276.1 conserved hypothetical protein [Roseobacter denitrificans OCh 114]AVL51762.1 long-chain fatty acid--CoA ligase [Roseobacter denitrificans]SFF79699.1 Acyl-CoA synthetase (AMP-forming)/AMP-acid ligase II [Roseobacter denitrificans OCh 114]
MVSLYDAGPFPPCPTPFNLTRHVLAAGRAHPQKQALLIVSADHTETWSFGALEAAVRGTATGFLRQGLTPGDVIVMRLGNTIDFPITYLAALAAGLVPVPTSAALTQSEAAFVIKTVSPKAVVAAPDIPCPDFAVTIDLETLQSFRSLPAAPYHLGDPERLGYIIFTSGTSGKPRAVAHAHRAIWARQMMFDGWYGLRPDDRLLHAGAFNWTYTLGTGLMDPWTLGATAVIPVAGTRPQELPALLARHDASIFAAAPGVYRQMLDRATPVPLPALRHGLSAGEKLPPALAERWVHATGRPVFEAYGMSECSTFISQCPADQNVAGTLGKPQKGRRIALLKNGEPVALGDEGTIAVARSDPGLMLGYLNAPQETAERMRGAWFLTGDQGVMNAQGHITYMGRDDDMMNAGGYRVSPIEVERVLADYPGITAVAVTEVRIKTDTTVIGAFYTGANALDADKLRAYVSQTLARYKQPRVFEHLPDLPMGANGKILRRVLRQRFERHHDRKDQD